MEVEGSLLVHLCSQGGRLSGATPSPGERFVRLLSLRIELIGLKLPSRNICCPRGWGLVTEDDSSSDKELVSGNRFPVRMILSTYTQ